MIGASNVDKEEETNEMAIIVVTNAIVHPRAMVVEVNPADAAHRAVVRSRRLPCTRALVFSTDFQVSFGVSTLVRDSDAALVRRRHTHVNVLVSAKRDV